MRRSSTTCRCMHWTSTPALAGKLIRRFASENEEVRETLARYVPAARRNDAAYMAAFYADAAPLATKLVWNGADDLEQLGTETDLLLSGVPPEGFAPLLAAIRNNLGQLNEARARVFVQQRSAGGGDAFHSGGGVGHSMANDLTSDNPYLSEPRVLSDRPHGALTILLASQRVVQRTSKFNYLQCQTIVRAPLTGTKDTTSGIPMTY